MSDYEHQRGKMIKVEAKPGTTLEEQCLAIFKEAGIEPADYFDTVAQALADEFYKTYVHINGELYKFIEIFDEDPYDSFVHIDENSPGIYSFNARWYNGGCGLAEMLEDGMNRLKKENETKRDSQEDLS